MTPTDTVLERLHNHGCNPRQSRPGQWTARCPNTAGHRNGDRHPSLSVAEGHDGAVLHCAGGCPPGDVVAALDLRMSDLYPPKEDTTERRIAATHDYYGPDGDLVMQTVRYHPKGFSQRQPDGFGGWVWNLKGIDERPLYRLPHVLDAVTSGATIWIVEGEKDVEALEREGHVATCNPMGAGKWRPEHTRWLTGAAAVEIIADDDEPGRAHAQAVAAALSPVVDEVRTWLPAAGCKDIAEMLGRGWPVARLRPFSPPLERTDDTEPSRLRRNLLIGDQILELPPVQWLVDGVIQADGLTVVYGPPKSYKTFVTLDMALHIANGMPWRGLATQAAKVLYVVAEGAPGVGPRARAWCRRHGGTLANLAWITVAPDLYNSATEYAELGDIAAEHGVALVVIDTLARSMPGAEENSAKDMGTVVSRLDRLKEHAGCAVIIVHHTGKDAARGMRGSNALQGAVDTSLEITGDTHAVNARVVDQKNAEAELAWWWRPTKEAPSVVLEPTTGSGSSGEVRDLNVLRQLQLMDDGGGVSTTTWEEAVVEREICGKTVFHERKKGLCDAGHVANVGSPKRPKWGLTVAGLAFLAGATSA